MILTIDVGNSNIVLGGVEGSDILFEARLRTEVTKTSDQYCVDLKILMEVYGVSSKDIEAGLQLLDILVKAKVIQSKSEGRQLIKQNGLLLNSEVVTDFAYLIKEDDFTEGEAIVRKGKKRFHKLTLSQ